MVNVSIFTKHGKYFFSENCQNLCKGEPSTTLTGYSTSTSSSVKESTSAAFTAADELTPAFSTSASSTTDETAPSTTGVCVCIISYK